MFSGNGMDWGRSWRVSRAAFCLIPYPDIIGTFYLKILWKTFNLHSFGEKSNCLPTVILACFSLEFKSRTISHPQGLVPLLGLCQGCYLRRCLEEKGDFCSINIWLWFYQRYKLQAKPDVKLEYFCCCGKLAF